MSGGSAEAPREELVDVPGASLWTVTQGAGTPLVLCHGGPGLCDNLGAVAGLVDDRALVHRYDQRGNGRSSREGPFDVATFVADLEALRHHWGHERWVVGGHSWGAALALFYAATHPDRTAAVLCISTTGVRWGWQPETRRHRLRRLRADERTELAALEDALRTGKAADADRARHLRLLWSTDFVSPSRARDVLDAGPLYAFTRNDRVFAAVADDQRRILDTGFAETVRGLPMPVVAVHGAGDAGVGGAETVANLAPAGQCLVLDDAGHSPWFEQPEALRSAILAVLDRA